MKKILAFTISLFVLFNLVVFSGNFTLGGTFGYYAVADSIYNDLYGSGNFIYGGFVSVGMIHRFEFRGDIGYFKDSGRTSLTGESTNFSLIPVAIGARVKLIKEKSLRPYFGAGASFYFYNEKARIGDTSGKVVGFYFEVGNYIVIGDRFHFDLNFRYIISDAKPFDETINLGGFNTGIGLGYTF